MLKDAGTVVPLSTDALGIISVRMQAWRAAAAWAMCSGIIGALAGETVAV